MAEETDLELSVRRSLERHAGEVDVSAPVTEGARGAVRRRRHTRVAIGAVAAAVIAVALTGALMAGGGDSDPGPVDHGNSLPSEWRTEHWRDMQVDVPADWGWGAAPKACGVGPLVGVDGKVGHDGAYVGRPIGNTDICVTEPERPPRAPYVWLGADVEPGVVDVGGGYVQETVEVSGSLLTVASDDPALRERILHSATGGETCFSELEEDPAADDDLGAGSDGITVCVYRQEQGSIDLAYAAILGPAPARAFELAYAHGEPQSSSGRDCDLGREFNWVVLLIDDRTYVVSPTGGGCPHVDGPEGPKRLTRDLAQPWAVQGIRAVVAAGFAGPRDNWVYDLFIGPQG